MASEQLEEYLEAIYDIGEKDGTAKTSSIARCLNVAPASVTEALQNLSGKGYVKYEPYKGATLTEQGRELAESVKRRHRLLEVFLSDVLNVKGETVHDEACKMEHTISDDTASALCKMLQAPSRCPHGSLISPCNREVTDCVSCLAGEPEPAEPRGEPIRPVSDLEPGQAGTIAFIRGDGNVVQRLSDLGLTVKTGISLVRKTPMDGPVEIAVRRTKLAIDRAIADNIFVTSAPVKT
ncbi:MAG TPA: metal-dependent transcriptional regulator [Methanoregulaceae archaeon]|nr:metal-dependent transcriptional regulator [Methanoregulaceae archaeon]HPD75459.1 metal-dependent transcriptional regulator [Methanoregulaceae archaeon]HRY75011.1 metal-dependent transcriptional regulator [Methanoregulaceae archaeon]